MLAKEESKELTRLGWIAKVNGYTVSPRGSTGYTLVDASKTTILTNATAKEIEQTLLAEIGLS